MKGQNVADLMMTDVIKKVAQNGVNDLFVALHLEYGLRAPRNVTKEQP